MYSGGWGPCQTSQSSACRVVLTDVLRGLGSMSGISEECMLGSVEGCTQGVGSMSGISGQCLLGDVKCCGMCSEVPVPQKHSSVCDIFRP